MSRPLLLALVLCLIGLAAAVPATEPLHKIKLKRMDIVRKGEHNLMAFQRHHNTMSKRYASHLGIPPPTQEELHRRSFARALQIDEREGTTLQRRKFFNGALEKAGAINAAGELPEGARVLAGTSTVSAGVSGSAVASKASTGKAGGSATVAQGASKAMFTTVPTGSTKNGFSQLDLTASGGTGPDPLLSASGTLSSQSVNYIIEGNDVGYLAEIQIGTPPQPFLMLIDSGSSDTWVPSSTCTACGTHASVGAKSSTFKASTTPWNITYGSGSAGGVLVQDTMEIAGLKVAAHTFGATTKESVQFSSASVPFDGLSGTALSSLSTQKVPTLIESLASSGAIKSAVIGYALGRVADGVNSGELTIGGSDPAHLDAKTTQTVPNTSKTGFWQAAMSVVAVDGKTALTGKQAILDTGTTLIFAPTADANALHALIPGSKSDGQGGYTIPCTSTAIVQMTFGNVAFGIDARDMTFLPVNDAQPTGDCISSVVAGQISDAQTWLVGDAFLKNVYFQTDVANNAISLSARVVPTDVAAAAAGGGNGTPTQAAGGASGTAVAAEGKVSGASRRARIPFF